MPAENRVLETTSTGQGFPGSRTCHGEKNPWTAYAGKQSCPGLLSRKCPGSGSGALRNHGHISILRKPYYLLQLRTAKLESLTRGSRHCKPVDNPSVRYQPQVKATGESHATCMSHGQADLQSCTCIPETTFLVRSPRFHKLLAP